MGQSQAAATNDHPSSRGAAVGGTSRSQARLEGKAATVQAATVRVATDIQYSIPKLNLSRLPEAQQGGPGLSELNKGRRSSRTATTDGIRLSFPTPAVQGGGSGTAAADPATLGAAQGAPKGPQCSSSLPRYTSEANASKPSPWNSPLPSRNPSKASPRISPTTSPAPSRNASKATAGPPSAHSAKRALSAHAGTAPPGQQTARDTSLRVPGTAPPGPQAAGQAPRAPGTSPRGPSSAAQRASKETAPPPAKQASAAAPPAVRPAAPARRGSFAGRGSSKEKEASKEVETSNTRQTSPHLRALHRVRSWSIDPRRERALAGMSSVTNMFGLGADFLAPRREQPEPPQLQPQQPARQQPPSRQQLSRKQQQQQQQQQDGQQPQEQQQQPLPQRGPDGKPPPKAPRSKGSTVQPASRGRAGSTEDSGLDLRAGPPLAGVLGRRNSSGLGTEVRLHVYDAMWLASDNLPIVHLGVEIYGCEFSFGDAGVRSFKPGTYDKTRHRETLLLGCTAMRRREVYELLMALKEEYPGERYRLVGCNCQTFAAVLCERLGLCACIPEPYLYFAKPWTFATGVDLGDFMSGGLTASLGSNSRSSGSGSGNTEMALGLASDAAAKGDASACECSLSMPETHAGQGR